MPLGKPYGDGGGVDVDADILDDDWLIHWSMIDLILEYKIL